MIPTKIETPYQTKARTIAMGMAPHVAVSTVDTYVAATSALALPSMAALHSSSALVSSIAQGAANASSALPYICVPMGIAHGIAGCVYMWSDSPYTKNSLPDKARTMKAWGEWITGAGLAAQAGIGLWALPITAVGLITTLAAQAAEVRSQA